jgi:hypothetical protein
MDRLDAIFEGFREERRRRKADPSAEKAAALLERAQPQQRDVILDPAKRKAVLCAARAGKSYTLALYILHTLLVEPRADVLYIAFIRSEAKEIMWMLLKGLDEEFQLGFKFGEAELVITNGRGGRARLAGCESWGDVDKFRGVPRHLVVLDEAATWHAQLLDDLIHKVIEPRLGDYKGTLVLAGTPGEILAGPFHDATGPEATAIVEDDGARRAVSRPFAARADASWADVAWKWSLHGWALADNQSERGQNAYAEALALKARNKWSDDNPIWVREYLGRWMADDSKLVFRFEPGKNTWAPREDDRSAANPFGLPAGHYWRFVVACDMGFHDPFALQVGAFSDTHPDLFQVYEYEATRLTVAGVAQAVKRVLELIDAEDVEAMVADLQGLGGMVVESLGQEHGLWFEKLEQRDKRDHVELANSGLVDRRIWIMGGSRLSEEMLYLAWDATGLKTRPNQPNHNCDAFLGVVRHSRHLEARPAPDVPLPGTPAFEAVRERGERLALGKKLQRAARGGEPNDSDFQV